MKLVRFGICALVVFAVLAHRGVEDWAKAVLETCAGLLFLFWSVRHHLRKDDPQVILSPLLPPLVALALVALAQLLLHATASAYETRMDLNLLVAYILL